MGSTRHLLYLIPSFLKNLILSSPSLPLSLSPRPLSLSLGARRRHACARPASTICGGQPEQRGASSLPPARGRHGNSGGRQAAAQVVGLIAAAVAPVLSAVMGGRSRGSVSSRVRAGRMHGYAAGSVPVDGPPRNDHERRGEQRRSSSQRP